MKDHRRFHSPFQIRHMIIGRAGTAWGQYQQCLREIHARRMATAEDAKRLIEAIGLEQQDIAMAMKERVDELHLFIDIAKNLRAQIIAEHGELTMETIDRLDADLWMHRLRISAAMDLFRFGAVSSETIELMLSCPIEMRKALLDEVENDKEGLRAFALSLDARPLIATS